MRFIDSRLFKRSFKPLLLSLLTASAFAVNADSPRSTLSQPPVPLLWKVSDADSSLYLLGSFHLLSADDYPLSTDAETAFADAESLLFELAPAEMESPALAGRLTFFLAAVIGVLSGVLVAPLTTIYYDSGFLIGLKGFVAAIIGGLASYPLAAAGAILVGLLESFSSFWASAFKDVIVFTLIIPVLMWRSLTSHHVEEEE